MKKIRILICDDHQIIVDGLKALVNSIEGFEVIATANNGKEAVEISDILSFDIILMDIDMPILNGLDATTIIKKKNNKARVIILSVHSDKSMIKNLIDTGVDGYLLKNCSKEELENAINQVYSANQYFSSGVTKSLLTEEKDKINENLNEDLTSREIEILKLIAQGFTNKEIGNKLFISHRTVDTHRTNMMKKLKVKNVAGLISYALTNKIIK